MTDNVRHTEVSNADDSGPGKTDALGLGERLRSARKATAMSLEQVAESLHLDETSVVALEEEQFEALGAPVFVRGHLKAYARLVGLPADSFVEAYQATDPIQLSMPVVQRSVDRSVTINPVMWGFCGLLILLGLILAWYVAQDDATPEQAIVMPAVLPGSISVPAAPAPEPSPAGVVSPARISEPEPATVPSATTESGVADMPRADSPTREPQAAVAAESVAAGPSNAQVAGDLTRLSLHFREESWAEISDVNRRLLFGLQREGHRELAGKPPFQILLGNAAGVDLRVNDEPYPIPSTGRTGRVARFEIQGAF